MPTTAVLGLPRDQFSGPWLFSTAEARTINSSSYNCRLHLSVALSSPRPPPPRCRRAKLGGPGGALRGQLRYSRREESGLARTTQTGVIQVPPHTTTLAKQTPTTREATVALGLPARQEPCVAIVVVVVVVGLLDREVTLRLGERLVLLAAQHLLRAQPRARTDGRTISRRRRGGGDA